VKRARRRPRGLAYAFDLVLTTAAYAVVAVPTGCRTPPRHGPTAGRRADDAVAGTATSVATTIPTTGANFTLMLSSRTVMRRVHRHRPFVKHVIRQRGGVPYETDVVVCQICGRVLEERPVKRAGA
jgi:hypothetical protein